MGELDHSGLVFDKHQMEFETLGVSRPVSIFSGRVLLSVLACAFRVSFAVRPRCLSFLCLCTESVRFVQARTDSDQEEHENEERRQEAEQRKIQNEEGQRKTTERPIISNHVNVEMFDRRFESRSDCEASWWLSVQKLQGPMTRAHWRRLQITMQQTARTDTPDNTDNMRERLFLNQVDRNTEKRFFLLGNKSSLAVLERE